MAKSTRSGYSNARENPPEAGEVVVEAAEEAPAEEPAVEAVTEVDNDPVEEPRPKATKKK